MIASVMHRLRRLIGDESGPTAVEYAVMLALIIVVCLFAIRAVGTQTQGVFQSTSQALSTSQDGRTDGNQDGNGQF